MYTWKMLEFEQFYKDNYLFAIRRTILKVNGVEDAEEIVGDAFLSLCKIMKKGKLDTPKNYFARVLSNLIIDYYRKNQTKADRLGKVYSIERDYAHEAYGGLQLGDTNMDCAQESELREGYERLKRLLTPSELALFMAIVYERRTTTELEKEFETNAGNLHVRIGRIRKKLKPKKIIFRHKRTKAPLREAFV